MNLQKKQFGNKEVTRFTIPSGEIATQLSCLERIATILELGIITTKSIGLQPRAGNREPILAQYTLGCFINAVGLTNPGAKEFARRLEELNLPPKKFLLVSIFGKDADEFVEVAQTIGKLEKIVDGFELNLSCPHAKGYGMQLGQDKDTVYAITKAVVDAVSKPVLAKLTPNVNNIGEIARSAISAGAYGLVAINTVGPGYYSFDGFPVLTNKVGGLSGAAITPIGLRSIREIREAIGTGIPIIGMGGIRTARDVKEYESVGADFFGIGSALAGMTEGEIREYFSTLFSDIENGTNNAEGLLKTVDMRYRKVRIEQVERLSEDFNIIRTGEDIAAEPGQFVFCWIPNVGEKPFSILDDTPLTLSILERGEFTKKINSLRAGDEFYIRGPYGRGISIPEQSATVLVGGGCGIAGIFLLAKRLSGHSKALTLLGAKDREHIPYLKEFERYSEIKIATEDGSIGRKGLVTDLLANHNFSQGSYFFNCGPRAMVDAVLPLELEVSSPERVYSSIDYMTRCGVGICGSCADERGRRTCVEGPFVSAE